MDMLTGIINQFGGAGQPVGAGTGQNIYMGTPTLEEETNMANYFGYNPQDWLGQFTEFQGPTAPSSNEDWFDAQNSDW